MAFQKILGQYVKFGVALFLIVVSLNACEQPAMVNAETGEADGQQIYSYYCTSCHGPKGDRKVGQAPDLTKSILEDAEIRKMILFGSDNGMAAYQSLLEEEELGALVEHVKSLRN
jgi:mono/diheme cytochrome c family protein